MIYSDSMYMPSPTSCVDDLTPPTFAGISSMAPQPGGSILLGWPIATDTEATEIEYEVYFKKGQGITAAQLFVLANRIVITPKLSFRVFRDELNLLLAAGETYFAGVRSRNDDRVRDTNIVMLSAISSGVLDDDCASLSTKVAAMINTISGDLLAEIDDDLELEGELDDEGLEATIDDCP